MKGMRSAKLPDNHWTKDMKNVDCADMKYTNMSAPEEYTKRADALAKYVDKNKAKQG